MDNSYVSPDILTRPDKLEDAFLLGLQDIRSIKTEIQKQTGTNPKLEPLLEAEEVAKLLGVDVGYVYSQARAKKIPSVKIGKYRKFSPSQLKKWLDRKNSS
jgi:excisionase family DNA binding protein